MFIRLLVLVSISLSLSACLQVDDQTAATAEMRPYINPQPVAAKALNYKVLIAIMDSGLDYNHPALNDKVLFTFNDKGEATGTGWDFLGNDSWPAPYIVRTAATKSGADENVRQNENMWKTGTERIIKAEPALAKFLNPYQDLEKEEIVAIQHGTHVAGLASYDAPEIALVPFRVLPQSVSTARDFDYNADFFKNLESGISRAKAMGAKVVNMSLGMSFGSDAQAMAKLKPLFAHFESFVKQNPDLIFVAAAGNDGKWVDGSSRYSIPCGVNAANLLCVGSIGPNGKISDFSNVPLLNSPVIYAPGEDIISTLPTAYCKSTSKASVNRVGDGYVEKLYPSATPKQMEEYRKYFLSEVLKGLKKDCLENFKPYGQLSGTSMASPIIARLLALESLSMPTSSGAEVIQSLLAKAEKSQIGPLSIFKLRAPKPSWYKEFAELDKNKTLNLNHLLFKKSVLDEDGFEFIVPQ